ncbi:diphosphomevalonate decarboxylase [Microbacteriaceae bacterium VKM Ac-2854]|nr:diphosphomevalonate decarboxylase [Microbacteriaceae bacterium VKM Ac-2854]
MTTATTATAMANPNIALIKYWGKRDDALILPMTGSLSLTLDAAPTTTSVTLTGDEADVVRLNGAEPTGTARERVTRFLDLVRGMAGSDERVLVDSVNLIPTGAGLASSASGFAALALAAATAFGLELSPRELSRLARRGSGSASRSIFGGLVEWYPGSDEESYAEPLDAPGLDLGMVLVVLVGGPKAVSSREAMRRTVDTSPFYPAWLTDVPQELVAMRSAIAAADVTAIGELAERNALRMHATMLGAVPPVVYWAPDTLVLLELVRTLRAEGLECYATMDAGPNVKILGRAADVDRVAEAVLLARPGTSVVRARSGEGARLTTDGAVL